MNSEKDELIRYSITLYGIVQGVGFRPFVYNLATELRIKGFVKNMGSSVVIDAEAPKHVIKSFINRLIKEPPPLAQIERISIRKKEQQLWHSFEIIQSGKAKEELSFIPRDIATCDNCKREIFDEGSRWFGYAFTNCTNCGPRYSIIKELPYDRCNTSMGSFAMCADCSTEYHNPSSRRFHAQPVCCEGCGPKLQLLDRAGQLILCDDAVKKAVQLLKQGSIFAVKGIGGFHLMCDGENEQAIGTLRNRKRRPGKPLAVMAKDVDTIKAWCMVDDIEAELLQSPASPIVLLDKKDGCSLPNLIAPDTNSIGMMLPNTPLHHLLFRFGISCLVATSGNISGNPIEYDNAEALDKLSDVVDYFLIHNRDINIPVDDTVAKVFRGNTLLTRLGRGYAPLNINLGIKHQIAALGAEEKAAICLSKGGYIFMSQYLGDLKNPQAFQNYRKVMDNLQRLIKIKPAAYAHDLHPDYLSTRYAMEQEETKISVQHHFAHMLSCMAENKLKKPAIGVVFDGTGLGDDGSIWGGEFLIGDFNGYKRAGHLKYINIQGGDKAILEPWRTAVSCMHQIGLSDWVLFKDIEEYALELVIEALKNGLNCNETSSMGRLFDCVAAMLGLCHSITYDAQGAILLESVADRHTNESYNYSIYSMGDCLNIDYEELLRGVLVDKKKGKKTAEIAGKLHNTIASFTEDAVKAISRQCGIKDVVLSGGCFENSLLLGLVLDGLERQGFRVYLHKLLPFNDGGIPLGQLAAADTILQR